MNIEEAKNKKAKAEMEIAHILEKLEAETGLKANNIFIYIHREEEKSALTASPHRAYKNQYNLNVITMEIKNGIIIDGVLHKAVQYKINCKRCSLLSMCQKFNVVCAIIGCEAFVNCGKVTDIKIDKEE